MIKTIHYNITTLLDIEEIECVEKFEEPVGCNWENVEELKDKQRELYKDNVYSEYLEMGGIGISYFSDINSFKMYNIKLKEGKTPDNYEDEEGIIYLYLGSEYKDIKIGSKYKINDQFEAVVAGIFEKGQNVINTFGFSGSVDLGNENIVYNLDSHIVAVLNSIDNKNYEYYGKCLLTLNEDYDYEIATKKIRSICEENGIIVRFISVSEAFDELDKNNGLFINLLEELMIVVTLSSILISSCIMILDIKKNQKMYGIMCANGSTTIDIVKSILLENETIMILSMLLALLITITQDKTIICNDVFLKMTLLKIGVFCIMLFLIASIAPIIYICRMDTKKMIEGEVV